MGNLLNVCLNIDIVKKSVNPLINFLKFDISSVKILNSCFESYNSISDLEIVYQQECPQINESFSEGAIFI